MTALNLAVGSRSRVGKPKFKLEWYVPKDATTKRGWLYVNVKTPPWGSSAREELTRIGFRDSESKHGQMYKTLGHYLDYEKMGGRSGEQSVHAVSVATGQSRHFATPKEAQEWIESEGRSVAKKEGISLNFALSTGARARSRTAAHRRSRTQGHLGASVSRRYSGPQVFRIAKHLDRDEAYRRAKSRATRDFRGFSYDARTAS